MAVTPNKIKGDLRIEGEIQVPNESAQRATEIDASGKLKASSVTSTELGHLSGVTSSVQTQLNAKASSTDLNNHMSDVSTHGVGEIVGTSETQTLTNKTINAASNTITELTNSSISTSAAIAESKLALDYSTSSLNTAINNHINDASDAHDASSISNIPSGNLSATDQQAVNNELQSDIDTRALDADVIKKNGSVAFTGNQSMGGNKLTNLAAPTSNGDALRYDQLGANNGIATLDAGGKIPVSQLPNSVMEFKGTFDPATATFTDGAGNAGDVYMATAAGSYNAGSGSITYAIGDFAVHDGSIFKHAPNSNSVTSVNGQQGVVVLDTDDINEGVSNLYFSEERAQDAVGNNLLDTATVNLTYNDGTGQISADVNDESIGTGKLIDASVTSDKIANDAVINSKILDSAVTETKIADDAVVTSKILNSNVTTAKIADSAVTGEKIADGVVDEGHLAATVAGPGITGGAGNQIAVDITNATAETSADNADLILIHDDSVNALRKMTRANFLAGLTTYTNEEAQDAVGTILTDSDTIDFTYNDGTPSIVADVKTQQSITSDASGIKLVNDVGTPVGRQYYGSDSSSNRGWFDLNQSDGDIKETSFALANNVASPTNVTGFAFSTSVVRSFHALVSVQVNATSDLFEVFEIRGIQKGSDFDISIQSTGDTSGVAFTITSAGQIQYTNINHSGFVDGFIKFRAFTTTV